LLTTSLTSQKTLVTTEDYQRRVVAAAVESTFLRCRSGIAAHAAGNPITSPHRRRCFSDQQIRVDNHWLYQASSARQSAQLKLIEERLRFWPIVWSTAQTRELIHRGRLDRILARPEYQRRGIDRS
jgi:hypothetical protein